MFFIFLLLSFNDISKSTKFGEHSWYTSVYSSSTKLKVRKIIHTLNGDIAGIGYTPLHTLFVRMDRYGNLKNVKIDTAYYMDFALTLVELPNRNFIWAGGMLLDSNSSYLYPAYGAIDSSGNLLWAHYVDSIQGDYIKDAALTSENNIIMITKYGHVIVISPDGDLLAIKEVPPSSWDPGYDATWYFYKIYKTVYNNFLLIGERDSGYNWEYSKAAIINVNSEGDTIWTHVFNSLPYEDNGYTNSFFSSAATVTNGNIVLVGGIADTSWSSVKTMIIVMDLYTRDTIRTNFFDYFKWPEEIAMLRTINDERYIILSSYQDNYTVYANIFSISSDLSIKYNFRYAFPSSPRADFILPTNLIQMSDGGYVFAVYGDNIDGHIGTRFIKPDPGFFLGPSFKITYPDDTLLLNTSDVNFDIIWQGPVSRYGNINYEIYFDDTFVSRTPCTLWNFSRFLSEGVHRIVVKGDDRMGVQMFPWEDTSYIFVKTYPSINCISQLHDTDFAGPFKVVAEIKDIPSGIDSAFLFYQRNLEDSEWIKVSMLSVADTNDIYYAIIPRCSFPLIDTIKFYIVAYDGASPPNVSFSPPHAPAKYYLFLANNPPSKIQEKVKPKEYQNVVVNITPHGIVFKIYPSEDGRISLHIWDAAGRNIYTLNRRVAGKKVNIIRLTPPVRGVYFYRLKGKNLEKEGKIFY